MMITSRYPEEYPSITERLINLYEEIGECSAYALTAKLNPNARLIYSNDDVVILTDDSVLIFSLLYALDCRLRVVVVFDAICWYLRDICCS